MPQAPPTNLRQTEIVISIQLVTIGKFSISGSKLLFCLPHFEFFVTVICGPNALCNHTQLYQHYMFSTPRNQPSKSGFNLTIYMLICQTVPILVTVGHGDGEGDKLFTYLSSSL